MDKLPPIPNGDEDDEEIIVDGMMPAQDAMNMATSAADFWVAAHERLGGSLALVAVELTGKFLNIVLQNYFIGVKTAQENAPEE